MERKRVGGVLVKLELGMESGFGNPLGRNKTFSWVFFSFVAGDRRVKFWIDKWGGDEPLCVSFPSLYALAVAKEAWVADLWVQHGKRGH